MLFNPKWSKVMYKRDLDNIQDIEYRYNLDKDEELFQVPLPNYIGNHSLINDPKIFDIDTKEIEHDISVFHIP